MTHQLTGAIALPDGTLIRGRGRREPMPGGPLPDVGLWLGRPPDRADRADQAGWVRRVSRSRGRPAEPAWPVEWIDWPDFRVPRDGPAAVIAIQRAYESARTGARVEVTCGGGTGRTGTVIACLAVLAGHPAADAVAWTRGHYRPRAVETPGQRRWIGWFATSVGAR